MNYSHRLKTDTSSLHEMAESSMYAKEIMQERLSECQYKTLISVLYRFHVMAEDAVFNALRGDQHALELSKRRKLPNLREDLRALGIAEEHGTAIEEVSPEEAVGWLYVMEGASLGGQVIVRKLSRLPGIANLNAMNYYKGYGPFTGSMWTEFKQFLDGKATDMDYDKILAGARNAYDLLLRTSRSFLPASY